MSARLEPGDHGGAYCGNPLGCAVACAVITSLMEDDISANVAKVGGYALEVIRGWRDAYLPLIREVRWRGLLIAIEFRDEGTAGRITDCCLNMGLFVTRTRCDCIRIFPALNITEREMEEGLGLLERAVVETLGT